MDLVNGIKLGSGLRNSLTWKLAAVVATCCLIASAGVSQISPGPLSRAHSSLNGSTNCVACHKLGALRTYKCLECHTEIASRVAAGKGFHAQVVQKNSGSQGCSSCHSEHNGEDFGLIRWEPSIERFDHTKAGWPLEGKHAGLTCQRCHTAARVSQAERSSIRIKDLSRTFLGLPMACSACHQDPHQGRLGSSCERCHTANGWKSVANFDHSKTRFPLTGAHSQVTCAKCHTAGPDGSPRWTGLQFARCADCHADPHQGTFAKSCESCHNTSGWRAVSTAVALSNFDHSKTRYPLLGKHATVKCDSCHKSGDLNKPLAFDKCTSCHTPDPHGGQFVKRADRGECSSCHTVAGFKPANFGLKEHAATAYPLEAKHAAVACAKCHIPAGTATIYKLKFALCTNCHKDEHLTQFAAAPHLNRCQDCHTVQGFRPSTFTFAMHKTSRFTLTGAHIAVACTDCHKPGLSAQFKDVAQYRFEDRSCAACHRDPHHGQFRERMIRLTTGGRQAGCEACHAVTTWNDVSHFDHGTTGFPLLGAHRTIACAGCHKPPNLEVKLTNVDFHSAPTACEACHSDVHAGQFAGAGKITRCASCHNSAKWKPSTFDHDRKTGFPLQGEHKNVLCQGCHKNVKIIDDKPVLFYKPTPKECSACHGAEIKKSAGDFGVPGPLKDWKFLLASGKNLPGSREIPFVHMANY